MMRRLILAIPIAKRAAAIAKLNEITGGDCSGLFQPEYNTSGNSRAPATHCALNWSMSDSLYDLIRSEFSRGPWVSKMAEGDPALRQDKAKAKEADFFDSIGIKKVRREAR
tara:strand:+ start:19056 stop:19388 length:333 start_codon:yes stop_codon:yes gene_type:complete